MRTSRAGTWNDRGFTLIELTIALLVMGLLMGVAVAYVHGPTDLRSAGRSLTGMVRTAYTLAVVSRQVQRLCVDLGRGEYWVDPDVCGVARSGAAAGRAAVRQETLSHGARFIDVQTGRHGTVREGVVAVLFFPIGRVEQGVIHLEDQSGSRLSLLIHPVTGLVAIQDGYVDGSVPESSTYGSGW